MSDTVTILFKPQNCFPPSNAPHYFDRLKLVPGSSNQLTPDEVTALLAHPDYPRYRDWKAIEVLGETSQIVDHSSTQAVGGNLSNLSADDAEKAIEECHDVALLQVWYAAETRRPTRQQIQRRIKAIESGNE